ncbi:FAD-binding protein [Achromobacter seleniivolatilans]|uniref:FAD-binding protein n=1 Tax=Achromobacter seleniivolatilans TaxID=3047478 RepID=A0ABY9M0J8_9BURK|nr:FAD-binding protein [Achromobacter sp. R39]WMD20536.1 FAD-binding protein [Achromobacter sp. R39]
MQPSRRAFLLGRRPAQTPWAAFVQRLTLLCQGQLRDLGEEGADGPRAILTPIRDADVAHARSLCAEYRVVLQLEGAQGPYAPIAGPCLRVDPSLMAGLARLGGDTPRWRAQPGVPLAALAQAGLQQFSGLPGAMTLAEWLAAPAPWPAGRCAASGVLAVDVMLADGIEETLGPFGEADVQPLRSATVQSLVPALFQLASGGDAFATNDGYHWLGRYRLDALKPEAPATVNLAHLLLGHGGTLAWVQSVMLTDAPAWRAAGPAPSTPGLATFRLDGRVKEAFDPHGRFPLFLSNEN